MLTRRMPLQFDIKSCSIPSTRRTPHRNHRYKYQPLLPPRPPLIPSPRSTISPSIPPPPKPARKPSHPLLPIHSPSRLLTNVSRLQNAGNGQMTDVTLGQHNPGVGGTWMAGALDGSAMVFDFLNDTCKTRFPSWNP